MNDCKKWLPNLSHFHYHYFRIVLFILSQIKTLMMCTTVVHNHIFPTAMYGRRWHTRKGSMKSWNLNTSFPMQKFLPTADFNRLNKVENSIFKNRCKKGRKRALVAKSFIDIANVLKYKFIMSGYSEEKKDNEWSPVVTSARWCQITYSCLIYIKNNY